MKKSFNSMGWKHDFSQFVLGHRLYKNDGTVFEAGVSQKLNNTLAGFHTKGDLATWIAATEALGQSGAEAHAFSMLQGFGAPLLKLTGFNGITFAMVGETGVGKTMMARFALSIYGQFDKLLIEFKSTQNAKIERLCAYNNLPAYIDEMTNLPPEEVSQLMYDVSGGKGRERLNRDGSSRGQGEWSTFLITSANSSFAQKLVGAKADAEAELMRLFEYEVPRLGNDFVDYMKGLAPLLTENYGLAGPVYVQWLVTHVPTVRSIVDEIKKHLESQINSDGRERFWVGGIACCIAGAFIAKMLGLIKFDPQPVLEWATDQMKRGLWDAEEGKFDAVSFLGEFFDETAGTRLVLSSTNLGMGLESGAVVKSPGFGSALNARFELDTKVAYVSRKALHDYANKRKVNFLQWRRELTTRGVLRRHDARKILGVGTTLSGAQVPCWELDLKHPAFADLLKTLQAEAAAPQKEAA